MAWEVAMAAGTFLTSVGACIGVMRVRSDAERDNETHRRAATYLADELVKTHERLKEMEGENEALGGRLALHMAMLNELRTHTGLALDDQALREFADRPWPPAPWSGWEGQPSAACPQQSTPREGDGHDKPDHRGI